MTKIDTSTRSAWLRELESLPERKQGKGPIPAFFFAHGHPGIYFPSEQPDRPGLQGVDGPLHQFLKDFGPALLRKYNPSAIVTFSAHWEAKGEMLVTDYGNDQPLLYDYYGFPDHFYTTQWHSNGSSAISSHVVSTLKSAGIPARTTTRLEPRGEDGKTGPAAGLDHGVFIPFKLMFPEGENGTFPIPVIQVSIDGSLDPIKNIQLGKAVSSLRHENILILSGGLTVHTFRDWSEWKADTAGQPVLDFESSIVSNALKSNTEERLEGLMNLKKLPGFKIAHPREEHFVPIWVAAGAGSDQGKSVLITDIHGCKTIAFGVE
ncbi:Extradiol ring-cleavage dioxygenase, class III enzyme, subunit B [Melampsora americana]|nr:Extradiol ring-cleavage dioxygenase, class III enzyme, subunit B [Melampsora americana]